MINAREAVKVIKFGLVGGLATLTHIGVATVFFRLSSDAMWSNVIGFAVAFTVSLAGHLVWTFQVRSNHMTASFRFLLVAIAGFCLSNSLILAGRYFGWPECANLAAAIMIVPPTSFILSRFWVFRVRSTE